jgi:hypothetical protein
MYMREAGGAPERDRYTLAGETGPPVRQAGAG